jgi:tetratricopeptide (TPR) repeat protein
MRFTKFIIQLIVFIFFIHTLYAQSTATVNDADAKFKQAKDFYNKELYSLSYPLFKELSEDKNEKSLTPFLIQNEAKFYSLISALQLSDSMAVNNAEMWLQTASAPQAAQLNYYIAEYYFRKNQFAQAAAHYEKAELSYFNNEQIAQIKFNQAYSYFNLKRFSQAKPLFNTIRQMPNNANYYDANYYYGFIAFTDKNYTDALDAFQKAEAQPPYKNIIPYYLAQLYYLNGNKEKALQYAIQSLQDGNQHYDLPLKQLIGYILFEKKQFTKALPYLEEYVSNTPKVSREDIYELSYCYYVSQQWTKAIKGFKELSGKEDSLTQNSMYLLADAYLKIGDKPNARNAFLFCTTNSSNSKQTEISLFHYAKLSYELGYKNIALQELQRFIQTYTSSAYNSEAKELLISLLSNTNNFKEALALYESLPATNTQLKQLYPKLLYGRAMEYINAQQLNNAQLLLNKMLHVPYNNTFLQAAYFWKGEIAYRLHKPDSAVIYLNKYLANAVNSKEVNTQNAH